MNDRFLIHVMRADSNWFSAHRRLSLSLQSGLNLVRNSLLLSLNLDSARSDFSLRNRRLGPFTASLPWSFFLLNDSIYIKVDMPWGSSILVRLFRLSYRIDGNYFTESPPRLAPPTSWRLVPIQGGLIWKSLLLSSSASVLRAAGTASISIANFSTSSAYVRLDLGKATN